MANIYKYDPDYIGIDNGNAYWGAYIGNLTYTANNYTCFCFTYSSYSNANEKYTFVWDNDFFDDSVLDARYGAGLWWHFYADFSTTDKYFGMTAGGLLPSTHYKCKGEYYFNGTWYTMATTLDSTTPAMTKPSATQYLPSYEPAVRSQEVYIDGYYYGEAGTCVANALASACEIFENKERAWTSTYFSNVFIYGNYDHNGSLGMVTTEAIEQVKTYGTPKWDRVPGCYDVWSDNRFYDDYSEVDGDYLGSGTGAMSIVSDNWSKLSTQALCQKINGDTNTNINFYDATTIASKIQSYGCVIINMGNPTTLDNAFAGITNGIVANPTTSYSRGGHSLLLIGWKTIGGVKYWIAQNGWGDTNGDYGWCYIPMDWGIGAPVPDYGATSIFNKWIDGCYQISNQTLSNAPVTPNTMTGTGRTDSGTSAGLNLTWNYTNYSDTYQVMYTKNGLDYYYQTISDGVNTISLTGLTYGTTYTLQVRGLNYYANGSYSPTVNYTTVPKTPTLTSTGNDATSIDVSVGVSAGNWDYVRVYYRIGTNAWSYQDITYPNTTGTITGLTPGSTYQLRANSYYNTVASYSYSSSIYVTVGYDRPANFAWTTSIASGNAVASFNLATKTICPIKATEWNAFTTRINDFRLYKGLTAYSFTTVSSSTTMTASIMNQAITAISNMSPPTSPPSCNTSTNVLSASFYNGLKNSLNSIV